MVFGPFCEHQHISMLILRVLLVREESRELLELLDSRDFQDPRVLLVRLANPESRYCLV